MKTRMRNPATFLLFVAMLTVPLMAFTLKGGDSFEIFLGNTKLIEQFIHVDKTVKQIDLSTASSHDQLRIHFNHCGQTGTSRTISLKDNQKILKEWKFSDIKPGESPRMSIAVKDITAIQKTQRGKNLVLFYTSDLMKEGHILATVVSDNASARNK